MNTKNHLETVQRINEAFRYYKSVESLFELDQWSGLPVRGAAYRQKTAAFIGEKKAELFFTDEAKAAYKYYVGVPASELGDGITRGLVRLFLTRYENATRVPEELMRSYNLIRTDAMNAWKQAREEKDYRLFEPWLKKAFDLKKEIALSIRPEAPAFDTLIGLTDAGLKSDLVSREFDVLKTGITNLLQRIEKSSVKADASMLAREQDEEAVLAFGRHLAHEMGYNEEKGGFNHRVIHGFTSFMGPQDARISTQRSGNLHLLFTCLHEAGHAMYATGGSDEINENGLWGGVEGGFHEANARFYENIIGKSRAYWKHYYQQLQEAFPSFRDVSPEAFYLALHEVKPSLRRIEADEVTYSLHVILRYELERDYFTGRLDAADMAKAWDDKCEAYFGIRPENDLQGVLQDMHWAGDYIGYFQSYALGNVYDGQIRNALLREMPDVFEDIAEGRFDRLNGFMKENIWQYGCCLTSGELMKHLCGTELDAGAFVAYLYEKYGALYQLD